MGHFLNEGMKSQDNFSLSSGALRRSRSKGLGEGSRKVIQELGKKKACQGNPAPGH